MTYLPDTTTEKLRILNKYRADYGMTPEEFTMRATRLDLGLCHDCDGYGLTGDDPSGQNLASCKACDESGLIPVSQMWADRSRDLSALAAACSLEGDIEGRDNARRQRDEAVRNMAAAQLTEGGN